MAHFTQNPEDLAGLVEHIWTLAEYPYKEYASWMFIHILDSGKIDGARYYEPLVDTLFNTDDQTMLRNVAVSLNQLKITPYRASELVDHYLSFIQDSSNKVALQVYSIYQLMQFCEKYPELTPEIREIIEMNSEGKTMSYGVAQRKFNKKFRQ